VTCNCCRGVAGTPDEDSARFIRWALQDKFTLKKFNHSKSGWLDPFEQAGPFKLPDFDKDDDTWILLTVDGEDEPVRLLHKMMDVSAVSDYPTGFVDVMPSYPIVAEAILDQVARRSQLAVFSRVFRAVVRGTSGIGKTFFGSFFAADRLRAGKHVFYERGEFAVHLDPESVVATRYISSSTEWKALLLRYGPDAYYIYDCSKRGDEVKDATMHIIVISSTDEENYKEFLKQSIATKFYFPRPARSSILEAYFALNGPEANTTEMDERIYVVGLKLRDVLHRLSWSLDDLKGDVDGAVASRSDEEKRYLLSNNNEGKARSLIVHEDAVRNDDGTVDVRRSRKFPASGYVIEEVLRDHWDLVSFGKAWARLRRPKDASSNGHRGTWFERSLPKKLEDISYRSIKADCSLLLPAVDFKTGAHSVEELNFNSVMRGSLSQNASMGTVLFAKKSNERSFDAIYRPLNAPSTSSVGLQMTVQNPETHGIYAEDALKRVDSGGIVQIWFVVPLAEFVAFKKRIHDSTTLPRLQPGFIGPGCEALSGNAALWEAKVVCIDDFDEITAALGAEATGVGEVARKNMLRRLLEEDMFLKPIDEISEDDWKKLGGVGAAKTSEIVSAIRALSPDLMRWWSCSELRFW
jgi:hypothetical protein